MHTVLHIVETFEIRTPYSGAYVDTSSEYVHLAVFGNDTVEGLHQVSESRFPADDYLLTAPGFGSAAFWIELGAIMDIGPLSVGTSVQELFNTVYIWKPHNISSLI